MAVAFDAVTEAVRTGTDDPFTFAHTPVGTPRGVVVLASENLDVDDIAGMTYGGVAMTRVVEARSSAGEFFRSVAYFVGASIPTGQQNVVVDTGGSAADHHYLCVTVTAGTDTEVLDFDKVEVDGADPAVVLSYAGRTALALAILNSGTNDPVSIAPGANCTLLESHDLGANASMGIRQTTPGSTDFTIGFTVVADDVALCALAVTEVAAVAAPQYDGLESRA